MQGDTTDPHHDNTCGFCDGDGEIDDPEADILGDVTIQCATCKGNGYIE